MPWLSLVLSSCGAEGGQDPAAAAQPPSTMVDATVPISLAPFQSAYLEIRGVAPAGWTQVRPGAFKQDSSTGDHTLLLHDAIPGITPEALIASTLTRILDLASFPAPVGASRTPHFEWQIYRITPHTLPPGATLDMALSSHDDHTYVVALLADAGEVEPLRDDVFLAAVNALEPTPGTRTAYSAALHEENVAAFAYDPTLPLAVREEAETPGPDHSEIFLSFDSPRGGRVPATLLVPRGNGPFPGMVMMHGMPSNRHAMLGMARPYAAAGVVVILIDAPFARPENVGRAGGAVTFGERDRAEQIQLMVDLRRAVDLLTLRPEVDPTQLVYVGVSYGGAMGGLLAGLETRLAAYALVVGDGGLVAHFCGLDDLLGERAADVGSERWQSWLGHMWPIEPSHYVGQAAPAALLFQSGTDDTLVPAPEAHRYQHAGSEPKQIMWYSAGHSLGDAAIAEQARWLSQYIELNLEAF